MVNALDKGNFKKNRQTSFVECRGEALGKGVFLKKQISLPSVCGVTLGKEDF
jgi:hypothetical protein